MRSLIALFIKELLITLSYPLYHLFGRFVPKNEKDTSKTIIIVETWFNPHPLHLKWARYLEEKGFHVRVKNFPIHKESFNDKAKSLKEFIDQSHFNNVILVGVSAGGITSYTYLQQFGGWDRTHKFISVGSPFHGSKLAYLISFIKSGRELIPGSEFLKKLMSDEVKNPEKIVCLSATLDEMVSDSVGLTGVRKIILDEIGHNRLHLTSEKTYEQIVRLLKD